MLSTKKKTCKVLRWSVREREKQGVGEWLSGREREREREEVEADVVGEGEGDRERE